MLAEGAGVTGATEDMFGIAGFFAGPTIDWFRAEKLGATLLMRGIAGIFLE
jgi:hypothetical protein